MTTEPAEIVGSEQLAPPAPAVDGEPCSLVRHKITFFFEGWSPSSWDIEGVIKLLGFEQSAGNGFYQKYSGVDIYADVDLEIAFSRDMFSGKSTDQINGDINLILPIVETGIRQQILDAVMISLFREFRDEVSNLKPGQDPRKAISVRSHLKRLVDLRALKRAENAQLCFPRVLQ